MVNDFLLFSRNSSPQWLLLFKYTMSQKTSIYILINNSVKKLTNFWDIIIPYNKKCSRLKTVILVQFTQNLRLLQTHKHLLASDHPQNQINHSTYQMELFP